MALTVGQLTPGSGLAVDADALLRRAERAVKRARKSGAPVLLGFTTRVGAAVDPSAVVFASRAAGEDWFCFEQPDRGGSALAALGVVTRLTASGPSRFKQVSAAWRELALFKVSADGSSRAEVMQMVEIFRGKIIDVSKRSVIIEVTGSWDKIEAFERMVRPFGLIEMARTGEIAISRGRGET